MTLRQWTTPARFLALLACLLGLLVLFACSMGPAKGSLWAWFSGDAQAALIVGRLRLPRALLGAACGAALALSGACLQGLFRNPLADPSIIGVSIGAACGALVALVWLPQWPVVVPVMALAGALGVTVLTYAIAGKSARPTAETLLLAGIALNALGGSAIGLILALRADVYQVNQFVFWTLGSLAGANWTTLLGLSVVLAFAGVLLWRQAVVLDVLQLGEVSAHSLGVNLAHQRRVLVGVAAVLAAATVAACGTIGFIGLVPSYRLLLPASALLGACLLVLADLAARSVVAPAELQVGTLTALLGAPLFLYLLARKTA